MPAVSVVMCVYNGAPHLEAAVHSLLRQTFRDFELILIDDASTDETPRVAERLAGADGRIKFARSPHNDMIGSLNRGMALAQSPFVARMDADDMSHPDRLEVQVGFLRANPAVDIVGSSARIVGSDDVWKMPLAHDDIVSTMPFRNPVINPTTMLRRAAASDSFPGDLWYDARQKHAEDYDLWVRLALDHGLRFQNLPVPLIDYRRHAGSITHQFGSRSAVTAATIRLSQLQRLGLRPSGDEIALHTCIAERRFGDVAGSIDRCAEWLARLELANRATGVYPREAFAREVGRIWLEACGETVSSAGFAAVRTYLSARGVGIRPGDAYVQLARKTVKRGLRVLQRRAERRSST